MWPIIWGITRRYAPVVMLPVSITVGIIGYSLEWFIRKDVDQAKDTPSISASRHERILNEMATDDIKQLSDQSNKGKTIFDKNL